jgi:hypothetical protein
MCGKKKFETRTFPTKFRGDLLLCEGKTPHKLFREYDHRTEMLSLDNHYAPSHYLVPESFMMGFDGHATCVVNLTDCRLMTREDEELACCDWDPDLYVWEITDVRMIEPFPVRGTLNFFYVDDLLIKFK